MNKKFKYDIVVYAVMGIMAASFAIYQLSTYLHETSVARKEKEAAAREEASDKAAQQRLQAQMKADEYITLPGGAQDESSPSLQRVKARRPWGGGECHI